MRNRVSALALVMGALSVIGGLLPAVATASPAGALSSAATATRPGPVSNLGAFEIGHVVRLTWAYPANPVAGVTVRYAQGRRAPASPTDGTPVPLSAPAPSSARLTGLLSRTTYSAAVWTFDAAHHYSRRATSRFTTLAGPPASATISGTITDTDDHPLANVQVYVETINGTLGDGAHTDAAGNYTITVQAGDYYLGFDGALATGGNSDATGYIGDSVTETVHEGDNLTGVDATLHPGAAITGRVSDIAGNPLAGVVPNAIPVIPYVQVSGLSVAYLFGPSITRPSAENGTFSIRGLPHVPLRVCLDPTLDPVTGGTSDRGGYAGRCSSRAVIPSIGGSLDVGDTVLAAARGGVISGSVQDFAGRPVADAFVLAEPVGSDASYDVPRYAFSRSDGSYRIAVKPGRYRVCADPPTTSEGLGGTQTCAPATVTTGGHVSLSLRLGRAGGIAGRVLDPNGRPLADVEVTVEPADPRSDSYGLARTDANGQFEATGLDTGGYFVCFVPDPVTTTDFPTGIAPRCDLTKQVRVIVGAVRLGINARLGVGGAVTGRVTDDLGAPMPDTDITFVYVDSRLFSTTADVAPDGSYTIAGLPTGQYHVCADAFSKSNLSGDITRCYGGPPGDPFSGTRVTVTAGETTSGIDIALQPGGSLETTVRDESGQPIGGVNVAVVAPCDSNTGFCGGGLPLFGHRRDSTVVASDVTDADGTVTIDGLPGGQYAVCALAYYGTTSSGGSPSGYVDSCGGTTFDVDVVDHETTTVDRELTQAGRVVGTITDAQGRPLAGVRVTVSHSGASDYGAFPGDAGLPAEVAGPISDTFTDSNGHFVIHGVQPGEQTVCVDASAVTNGASRTGYVDACVGGPTRKTASPVQVDAGRSTVVHLSLDAAVAISGSVTTASGRGAGVLAIAFNAHGRVVDVVPTRHDGGYRMQGLVADTYFVCFYGLGRYQNECFNDVRWSGRRHVPGAAKPITLSPGQERRHVDAVLRKAT